MPRHRHHTFFTSFALLALRLIWLHIHRFNIYFRGGASQITIMVILLHKSKFGKKLKKASSFTFYYFSSSSLFVSFIFILCRIVLFVLILFSSPQKFFAPTTFSTSVSFSELIIALGLGASESSEAKYISLEEVS